MKTKKISQILIACTLISLFLGSCSVRKKPDSSEPTASHESPQGTQTGATDAPYSPPATPVVSIPQKKFDELTLLIPGEGIHAFSSVGAFEVFEAEKIPIKRIIAWDTGAIFAAAYAVSASVHEFQWKVQKLNETVFMQNDKHGIAGWISSGRNQTKQEDTIRKIFASLDFKNTRMSLVLLHKDGKIEEGNLADAVLKSLNEPPTSVNIENLSGSSDELLLPLVSSDKKIFNPSPEYEIQVPLSNIPSSDYSKRSVASFLGKKAAKEKLIWLKEHLNEK